MGRVSKILVFLSVFKSVESYTADMVFIMEHAVLGFDKILFFGVKNIVHISLWVSIQEGEHTALHLDLNFMTPFKGV